MQNATYAKMELFWEHETKRRNKMINQDELQIRCIGLENNGIFPLENTGRGTDISPEFVLENLSPAAKTIAITLEDIKHKENKTSSFQKLYTLAYMEHPGVKKNTQSNSSRQKSCLPQQCGTGNSLWLA